MPLSVIRAMHESKTPNAFLDRLLEAVKNNKWEYPLPKEGSNQELRRLAALSHQPGLKRYSGITFSSDKDPGNHMRMNIGLKERRLQLDETLGPLTSTSPRLILFNDLHLQLEGNWDEARELLGEEVLKTESASGPSHANHRLYIPVASIAHWGPFSRLKPVEERTGDGQGAYNHLMVTVDGDKLDELAKYREVNTMMSGFQNGMKLYAGKLSPMEFLSTLRLGPRDTVRLKDDAVQVMLKGLKRNYGFLKRMGELSSARLHGTTEEITKRQTDDIEEAITEHFGIRKCNFTRYRADHLAWMLKHSDNRRAARELSNQIELFKRRGEMA